VLAARHLPVCAPDLVPAANGLAATQFDDYRAQVIEACHASVAADPDARMVLIGASFGGLLALSVAAEVHAAALILINPMPPRGVIAKPLGKPYPALVPWGRERSIGGTRRALPDADDATCLYAFRNWRDESGLALEQARLGIAVEIPRCPILIMASELDDDVPVVVSRALATRCSADFERLSGCSHVGPLLGVNAAHVAERAAAWLHDRAAVPA
jgi:pimeloyl-ACP methyl ester carboxylesterase